MVLGTGTGRTRPWASGEARLRRSPIARLGSRDRERGGRRPAPSAVGPRRPGPRAPNLQAGRGGGVAGRGAGEGTEVDRSHEVRVGDRPGVPLLVFDGSCGFCRQWVERWRGITGDRVEYRPFQEGAGRFPEIGPEAFRARVWLIEPDGRATGGALAVLRLYALVGEKRWIGWLYRMVPGFAMLAEGAYDLVARHRDAAAVAARRLGIDVAHRPRY